jgi:hypothetical protein
MKCWGVIQVYDQSNDFSIMIDTLELSVDMLKRQIAEH